MNLVYTHNFEIDGKSTPFYVGKGTKRRAYNLNRNKYHANKISKYGKENVCVKIWSEHANDKDALLAEIELIAFLKENGIRLTNLTEGGDGAKGYKFSEESLRERMYGNSYAKGLKHTEETKNILRLISSKKRHTEETKKKIGAKQLGANNHMFGKVGPRRGIVVEEATRTLLSKAGKANQPMTDGIVNIVVPKRMVEAYACAGWVNGITKKKGWCGIWVTDGQSYKRVQPDAIPIGWRKGRK